MRGGDFAKDRNIARPACRQSPGASRGRCPMLNKTNQFNTSGKRWTTEEVDQLFGKGGYFLCSFLCDRTVDNGLIGVTVIS